MSTVSDWAGLIAPVTTLAGVLGGYWLAGHNDEGRDVRAAQREEAARVADYAKHLWDRRHEWQRQVTESGPPAQSAVLSVMAGQARNSYAGRSTRSARC
jgi:hypothetical protein